MYTHMHALLKPSHPMYTHASVPTPLLLQHMSMFCGDSLMQLYIMLSSGTIVGLIFQVDSQLPTQNSLSHDTSLAECVILASDWPCTFYTQGVFV